MQHIHHSHIISMIVGEKVKNLSTVKLVASMACQVYQITMGTQAMLDSGMVAAADISQVCQISAAKGTNFLAKDFACNKPGSIANTSGSESLSISRVKTSECTDHSKFLKFWINVAILPGILFFLSIQKVLGIHWCLDSIWWKCRSQWCFLMSFQSKSTHCFKLLSAASKSCKGTTVPCQVAWSKSMRHRIDKKASTSSLHALAGTHTTLI